MSKGRDGTKSQAISEYLAANKDANPKQIVAALKENGVQVSFGLASAVKYGTKGKKKASAKKAKRTVSTKTESKPAVSLSESIRQFIARNPKAKPKEIEAALKAEGVIAKLSLINAVKYSKAKKGGKQRRSSRTPVVHAAARAVRASTLSIDQLIEVKRFTDSIGGADQVRRVLDLLEKLQ